MHPDVELVRASNPGPFTLSGTNTWVVDPGPDLGEHVEAVLLAARRRGGVGGIAVTHDHGDHAGAVEALARRAGAPPVAAARLPGAQRVGEGDEAGPFR